MVHLFDSFVMRWPNSSCSSLLSSSSIYYWLASNVFKPDTSKGRHKVPNVFTPHICSLVVKKYHKKKKKTKQNKTKQNKTKTNKQTNKTKQNKTKQKQTKNKQTSKETKTKSKTKQSKAKQTKGKSKSKSKSKAKQSKPKTKQNTHKWLMEAYATMPKLRNIGPWFTQASSANVYIQ